MVRLKAAKLQLFNGNNDDFNSNMVRLKESTGDHSLHFLNYFNSNMVRLKEGTTVTAKLELFKFQFQYGSIKSMYDNN